VRIGIEELEDAIVVSVSDSGIGIKAEDLETMLVQGDIHSTLGTDRERGSGLGLMICKDFVEKHQGDLKVESEWGKGTKFSFTLKKGQNHKSA
jgi:signal transduction histidine kinase